MFGVRCTPQGLFEPILCWPGFYCPDPHTIHPCPEGHFCVSGASEPQRCRHFGHCPIGSITEQNSSYIFLSVLIDLALVVVLLVRTRRDIRKSRNSFFPQIFRNVQPKDISPPIQQRVLNTDTLRTMSSTTTTNASDDDCTAALVTAFETSFGGHSIDITCKELSFSMGSNVLLDNVSCHFQAGRMVAIIGPSGAGKTTFLNALMGKIQKSNGDIQINGTPAHLSQMQKIIGFVPQDDIMCRDLTVREVIYYSARTRLPHVWSNKQVNQFVDSIISVLRLSSVVHDIIGDEVKRGISGGQRKRVNIGIELAAAPLALFLDEPTSGIDSTSALSITKTLQQISRIGLNVISIVHQPGQELFATFDDVLMIGPGGKMAYFGPVSQSRAYFECLGFDLGDDSNVSHALMDILSGHGVLVDADKSVPTIDELARLWDSKASTAAENSLQNDLRKPCLLSNESFGSNATHVEIAIHEAQPSKTTVAELKALSSLRGAGFFRQIGLSHNRSMVQQSRQWMALLMELGVAVGAGFIIGIASYQKGETFHGIIVRPYRQISSPPNDYLVSLFGTLVGISVAMAAGPAGVRLFSEERLVFWREASSGHNRVAYFLGKNISALYRISLASLHFTAMYVYFTKPTYSLELQYVLVLLNFFCIYGVSILVSMLVRRDIAPLMAIIVGLFLALMNGSAPRLIDAQRSGMGFLFALSPNRWMTEAQYSLTLEIYQGRYDVELSLGLFGYEMDHTIRNLCMMLLLGFVYRIIAFGMMVLLHRDKQR
ncbi:P-loop containing nucleoside triphosphate hydrolase protein [Obelidium mucronatum]|nr:P-loop containing nucleoside triphosphate hydrolase protein [Obelidium mucronatum]